MATATKRSLIAAALSELGLPEYSFDASPEMLQDALVRLNRLMAQWDGQGLRVGYNFGNEIDAESGLPDTTEETVYTNLALRLAPTIGKSASVETRIAAKNGWNALYVARAVKPEVPLPGRLPVGAGNRPGVLGPQYCPESSATPGLNDGATEY